MHVSIQSKSLYLQPVCLFLAIFMCGTCLFFFFFFFFWRLRTLKIRSANITLYPRTDGRKEFDPFIISSTSYITRSPPFSSYGSIDLSPLPLYVEVVIRTTVACGVLHMQGDPLADRVELVEIKRLGMEKEIRQVLNSAMYYLQRVSIPTGTYDCRLLQPSEDT
ncbi:hypothetical protein F4818DRAFT_433453 [Hypoxylon cercidicola]|nr:hypothetical protein F4818DRAFT_433453 [Hypoxylon cercidicola]